ncbi:MAG: hypothetical protein ACJ786_37410, partial [Catenulispora sp.]
MPGIRQDGGRWAVSWSTDTEEVTDLATAVVNGRRVIVGGGADKALRLWDPVAGGQVGKPLTGHLAPVIAVAT